MRILASLIGLLIVAGTVLMVYKYYLSPTQSSGAAAPLQTIDTAGVQSDLLAIGQAERMYQAEHGSYASFDDLIASGAMSMRKPSRDGYTYELESSVDTFRVTANCPAATSPGCLNFVIDQTMQIHPGP